MSASERIEALEAMLRRRPGDLRARFGLAVEYLNAERDEEGISLLRDYLDEADDEGNGWARLGAALHERGRTEEARNAYERGIEQARAHGHPTLEAELSETLDGLGGG